MKYEIDNINELIELSKSNYRTKNGKDVLWLPVRVPQNTSVVDMLEDLFNKFTSLISNCIVVDKEFVEEKCNTIICILKCYLTGDVIKAYKLFSQMMDEYIKIIPFKFVERDIQFYRMRKELNKKEKNEFFHLPTSMREKCNAERFSIAGYPCFYIGYSKNDCYVEISKTGSIIGMSLKDNNQLKVLDLTFSEGQAKGNGMKEYLKAFPLIAACYVVLTNKEKTDEVKFREEYVIPQMLTSYLKHHGHYDGICYYSVRNENLYPLGRNDEDYRNLALFPVLDAKEEYDMTLMNRFQWCQPSNVG